MKQVIHISCIFVSSVTMWAIHLEMVAAAESGKSLVIKLYLFDETNVDVVCPFIP